MSAESTRFGRLLVAGILLWSVSAYAADLLIRDARLVGGTGVEPREGVSILIRDGRIAQIARGLAVEGVPVLFHGSSMLREVELLGEAGLTPLDAIASATRVPAAMLGLADEIGTVEVGKRADLVVVRDDPLADLRALRTIRWTVKDGVAHTPAEWMGP